MTVTQLKYPRRLLRVYDKLYPYIICVLLLSFHSITGERCNFDVDPCICTTSSFQLNLKSFMESRKGEDLQVKGDNNSFTYYMQPCNRHLSHKLQNCDLISPLLVVDIRLQKLHVSPMLKIGAPKHILQNYSEFDKQSIGSCQTDVKTKQAYGLGLLDMYDATQDQDNFILTNSFPSKDVIRILQLTVKCSDQEEEFTYDGNSGILTPITYRFTLGTRHVCAHASESNGLSPGSVMVIIFFVLLIVYLVGGLLFQKFVRKAQGLEIVPNYVFWRDFPFLVKDGIVFTFQCCKGSSGYDKI